MRRRRESRPRAPAGRARLSRRVRAALATCCAAGALVAIAAGADPPPGAGAQALARSGAPVVVAQAAPPGAPGAPGAPTVQRSRPTEPEPPDPGERLPAVSPRPGTPPPDRALVAAGRRLFVDACSSCHGADARGIPGRAPSLRGAGEAAADFYLRTGRMPLPSYDDQPLRAQPAYSEPDTRALVAYVGSFGGPPIPEVRPERGSLKQGLQLFTDRCAGCHQVVGRGGMHPGAQVPSLQEATATQVGEALAVGPYTMPHFRESLRREELDSLARYVLWTRDPEDEGGWGIGHIGPIPEGMVAWLLALATLILVARLIGERTTE